MFVDKNMAVKCHVPHVGLSANSSNPSWKFLQNSYLSVTIVVRN